MSIVNVLKEISSVGLSLNDFDFTKEQIRSNWLGYLPATSAEILEVEKKLGVKLPGDYLEFLSITNGFSATSPVGVGFLPIRQIDYLRVLDKDLLHVYTNPFIRAFTTRGEPESEEYLKTTRMLSESILIGDLEKEQYFLIQPPGQDDEKWQYFKFASWMPEEEKFAGLEEYLLDELAFLKEEKR